MCTICAWRYGALESAKGLCLANINILAKRLSLTLPESIWRSLVLSFIEMPSYIG